MATARTGPVGLETELLLTDPVEEPVQSEEGLLRRFLRRLLILLSILIGLVVIAIFVTVPLEPVAQLSLGALCFLAAVVLVRMERRSATIALAVFSVVVSSRYLFWRVARTVDAGWTPDGILSALLLGAESFAFVMLVLGYLQSVAPLRRVPVALPRDLGIWPTVDVFIPTFDEPLEVVRTTVLAAKAMDWPSKKLNIYILDDGRRHAFRAFAARAGVGYITRPDNKGAKAGNLNHALARTRGEFVTIFDADHVPTRSFLQVAMGGFLKNPRLALVQLPHYFYSPDPFERNLETFRSVPNEGELFYGLIQDGNDFWNAAFFCGSCAVLRRTALEEVGGIAAETVTEDAHTSLRLHRKGWDTAYIAIPQAAGLATETLSAHVKQRMRWARGMAQIFRVENPLLARGLTLPQRLCYLASMMYFLAGIPRLVFLIAPIGYLVFGLHILNASPLAVIAYALPHLAHARHANSWLQGEVRHSFWSQIYDSVLACYIAMPTTVALIDPRAGKFNVTAKGGRIERTFFDLAIAWPWIVLFLVNMFAIGCGVWRGWRGHNELDSVLLNLAWSVENTLILLAGIRAAFERRQVRAAPRVKVTLPAMVRRGESTWSCRTRDVAITGASLHVRGSRAFEPNDRVWLAVSACGADEVPIPCRVVAHERDLLRVSFEPASLEEEEAVVRMIFGRADAWTGWRTARRREHFVIGFGRLVRRALFGAPTRRGTAEPQRAPATPDREVALARSAQ